MSGNKIGYWEVTINSIWYVLVLQGDFAIYKPDEYNTLPIIYVKDLITGTDYKFPVHEAGTGEGHIIFKDKKLYIKDLEWVDSSSKVNITIDPELDKKEIVVQDTGTNIVNTYFEHCDCCGKGITVGDQYYTLKLQEHNDYVVGPDKIKLTMCAECTNKWISNSLSNIINKEDDK